MSHRKVYSQGNVPFSWEYKPGISKLATQDYPNNKDFRVDQALDLTYSSQDQDHLSHDNNNNNINIIPLPPCQRGLMSKQSGSGKGPKWQLLDHHRNEDDPFLLAYKECTKSDKHSKSDQFKNKKGSNNKPHFKKSRFMSFSCMSLNSCDVVSRNDNNSFVKLDNPQLPIGD